MLNKRKWLDSVEDSYIENFPKFFTENDFKESPIHFRLDNAGSLPLLIKSKQEHLNVFNYEESCLTEEYLKENKVGIFIKSEKDLLLSEKFQNLYFSSSSNLNSLKMSTLKTKLNKNIDFGVDPLSLGLWQSKLFKTKIPFGDLKKDWLESYKVFRISTLAYDMSGANLPQQLAILLSSCVQLIEDYEGDLSADDFFNRTSFEVSLDSNVLMNIVKLQSVRMMLDKLKEIYQVPTIKPSIIYSIANPRHLVSREIWNNLLRLTSVNMSSIMGGADAYVHLPYDLFLQSNENRISRNIELILQNESFLGKVQWPAKGSYTVDQTCESVCQTSWEFFQEIDNKDGLRNALRSGWLQNEIDNANQQEIDLHLNRNKKMIGVNDYVLARSLSEQNPLPKKEEVKDIQDWWNQFFFDEESEKLCDIDKLVPLQLSSFFEKWQLQADEMRRKKKSVNISLIVEPGLEKSAKVTLTKNLIQLSGCETSSLNTHSQNPVVVIVASDPDSDFANQIVENHKKEKSSLLLWAGDKNFKQFDGFVGAQSNLMELYAQIFKKLGGIS